MTAADAASFTPKWIRHALAAMVERLAQVVAFPFEEVQRRPGLIAFERWCDRFGDRHHASKVAATNVLINAERASLRVREFTDRLEHAETRRAVGRGLLPDERLICEPLDARDDV